MKNKKQTSKQTPKQGKTSVKHKQLKQGFQKGNKHGNRWKLGESGNPEGRPKKENCITSLMKNDMESIPALLPDRSINKQKLNWAQIIKNTLMFAAASGQADFMRMVLNRLEGKVPERLHHGLDTHPSDIVDLIRKNFKW